MRCLLTLLLLLPLAAAAQTYRWVDEKGHVHYTQLPPKSGKYDVIGPAAAPAPAPNQEALNEALKKDLEGAPAQQASVQQEAQRQAERQEACRQAIERLAYLEAQTPRRLGVTDESGNSARMSVEEFERRRAQAQQRIDQNCD